MKTRDAGTAAGLTTFVLLTLGVLLGNVNFARWDNMETFLPAIWYAHGELLHGRLPLWNPLQNLGEPLHALGIGGVLYPPYTVAVAIAKLLRLSPASALDLVAIAHATFGAIGLAKLLAELRVRRSLAVAAAVSGMLSGFALIMSAIWVHVLPNLAWSVWAMWGLRRVLAGEDDRPGIVMAAVALGAVFHTGHAQSGANVWLAVWTWTAGMALVNRMPARRYAWLLLSALSGALIALPSLLPTALILPEADRLARATTPGAKFLPHALLGILTPVIGLSDGARIHTALVNTFTGAWVAPAVLIGAGALFGPRRSHSRLADSPHARAFVVTTITAVLFMWLSLGPAGGLFSVLHDAPLWSRFRDAYKYYERAVPLLVVAAALGIELATRFRVARVFPLAAMLLPIVAGVLWARHPAHEPMAVIAGVTAIVTMAALVVLPAASASIALVPLVLLQSVALLASTHSPARSKSYEYDRVALARLPVPERDQRILPLSEGPPDHPYTRPLGIFYAPMLDGYASASGHRFALSSARLGRGLHTSVAGVPSGRRESLQTLLGGNFLKLADVRYLVVDQSDTAEDHAVRRKFPDARIIATPHARIFDIGPGAPRVYFATQQVTGDPTGVREVLYGAAPLFSAAVAGDKQRRALPSGEVLSFDWGRAHIRARVRAPEGGLLVFSTSYSREWIARADGTPVELKPVDELFAGVWLPPGTEMVDLRVRRWPFLGGLMGAFLGIALLWFAGWHRAPFCGGNRAK